MPTDAQILQTVQEAFANCPRPKHFTNHSHCPECAEHDELLRSRDLHTLCLEDVGNLASDPICFITPEGFAHYLPALVRITLADPVAPDDWYGTQLISHLCSDGHQNQRFLTCSTSQRDAVAGFLRHLIETRPDLAERNGCADNLFQALEIWLDEIHTDEVLPPGI